MPLFGKSQKTPQELTQSLGNPLALLIDANASTKKQEKAVEDIGKTLLQIKGHLYGVDGQEPQAEVVSQIAMGLYDCLYPLLQVCAKLEFETKKDLVQIFSNILRRQIGSRAPTVEYIVANKDMLFYMLKAYEQPEIALNCGHILRECIRYEPLAKILLKSEEFYNLFTYVELPYFDIASDAFSTFKDLLTRHKLLASKFLEENYSVVFEHPDHYQHLLHSENYVTKRQSLKLLGELLLDRHNFTTMTHYISNPENLKMMMNMLRDKSRNIQFEAFHVFKVFVANPNKVRSILEILVKNKEKLVEFLQNFHTDRTEDEQFNDEKNYLIKQIKELQPPPPQQQASQVVQGTS